ncbi:MAG: cupin domain-containing protein [Pseudolabrys sp.]|jgi:quercetin dioxygenase-like cupin family protein
MIRKPTAQVPGVVMDKPGFQGMTARFVLTRDDGMPHYALRIMEFAPGGHTSLHAHAEEHEFFFLEGEPAIVDGEGRETRLAPGDAVYTAPHEAHQIRNVGATVMRMVCTIPILPGGDGKSTSQQSGGTY